MTLFLTESENQEPVLGHGMVGVWDGRRQIIVENTCRFPEGHTMFFEVLLRLGWVPFEVHG